MSQQVSDVLDLNCSVGVKSPGVTGEGVAEGAQGDTSRHRAERLGRLT